ncbi:MAG: hypothetical protein IT428_09755 [Planctomycetaceae bacterium]|nr:hypothetical protein [Planctomycetaceae bacterium]
MDLVSRQATLEKKVVYRTILATLSWFALNVEVLVVIIVAATCAVLHLLHRIDEHLLPAVTLAMLALLGFSILHDRHGRGALQKSARDLTAVVSALNEKVDRPLAESFFTRETDEKSLLASADQEVWAVQETGALLTERYKNELIALLESGRKVRMVVTSPNEATARLLSLRNANLEPGDLLHRAKLLAAHAKDIVNRVGANAEHLEIRYLPYPVDATSVLVDPQHRLLARRRAVVRQAGFRVTYSQKLDFTLSAAGSPMVFAHYIDEARRAFAHAAKVVLVAGPPRSGKTRLFESILSQVGYPPELFYAISPALADRNKRLGFAVKVTGGGAPVTFATRTEQEHQYKCDEAIWPNVTAQLQDAAANHKVIVLDEVGQMQLACPDFTNFVRAAIDDTNVTMIAAIADDDSKHEILAWAKRHPRTTVLHLDGSNLSEIEAILLQELNASLRVARDLYRPLPGEMR